MILSAKPSPSRVMLELVIILVIVGLGLWLEPYVTPEVALNIYWTLLMLCLIGSVAFVGYYSRSNWRGTEATRAIMRLMATIVLLLIYAIAAYLTDYYHGQRVFAIALYGWLTYSVWRLLVTLRMEQIKATRHPLTNKET